AGVLEELVDRYGDFPEEVERLTVVSRLRMLCRDLDITEVIQTGTKISFSAVNLPDSGQVRLKRLFPAAVYRATPKTVLIPAPKEGSGMRAVPLRDDDLLQWCANALTDLAGVPRRNLREGEPVTR
ncbi:MAG: transcription-repair coupling factor, partial [Corynebacterium variabile]|nr:transcription-repair coupling factor [Corynebacterium variabile]